MNAFKGAFTRSVNRFDKGWTSVTAAHPQGQASLQRSRPRLPGCHSSY
jgi:hypothetical protein